MSSFTILFQRSFPFRDVVYTQVRFSLSDCQKDINNRTNAYIYLFRNVQQVFKMFALTLFTHSGTFVSWVCSHIVSSGFSPRTRLNSASCAVVNVNIRVGVFLRMVRWSWIMISKVCVCVCVCVWRIIPIFIVEGPRKPTTEPSSRVAGPRVWSGHFRLWKSVNHCTATFRNESMRRWFNRLGILFLTGVECRGSVASETDKNAKLFTYTP
jgi:hypothetical protein